MGRLISCPAPPIEITCTALRNLGNAGDVVPGQEYLVTDYNRGTVGAAQILTHGVTANTVSWNVSVQTQFDDSAWAARWDPDTCRIVDMFDNLGNKIRSDTGDEIETFPWGNPLVSGNDFTDVDFNYAAGTVRDNAGDPTARLDVNGGDVQQSQLSSLADARVNGTARMYRTEVASRGRVRLDGTAYIESSRVGEYSYVDTDSLTITYSRFDAQTYVYGDGAVGRIDNSSSDRGYIDVRNNPAVDIDDLSLESYGRILGNGADRIRIFRSSASDNGYFQASAGSEIDVVYSTVDAGSYARSRTGGVLTLDRVSISSNSYIDHNTPGANEVRYSSLSSQGYVIFQNTVTGNRIRYTEVNSLGLVRFRGTSTGSFVERSTVAANGRLDVQDSDNDRIYYVDISTISYLHLRNSDGVLVYYTTFDGYGRALLQGFTGRVLGTEVSGTAYVRILNGASDLRYSSFTAYFYYYLTGNAAIKQGLDGSGRQTYTEPNPAAAVTGAGERNW